jgi:hypothetical protein
MIGFGINLAGYTTRKTSLAVVEIKDRVAISTSRAKWLGSNPQGSPGEQVRARERAVRSLDFVGTNQIKFPNSHMRPNDSGPSRRDETRRSATAAANPQREEARTPSVLFVHGTGVREESLPYGRPSPEH